MKCEHCGYDETALGIRDFLSAVGGMLGVTLALKLTRKDLAKLGVQECDCAPCRSIRAQLAAQPAQAAEGPDFERKS